MLYVWWALGIAMAMVVGTALKAPDQATAIGVGGPVVVALVIFVLIGLLRPWRKPGYRTCRSR